MSRSESAGYRAIWRDVGGRLCFLCLLAAVCAAVSVFPYEASAGSGGGYSPGCVSVVTDPILHTKPGLEVKFVDQCDGGSKTFVCWIDFGYDHDLWQCRTVPQHSFGETLFFMKSGSTIWYLTCQGGDGTECAECGSKWEHWMDGRREDPRAIWKRVNQFCKSLPALQQHDPEKERRADREEPK